MHNFDVFLLEHQMVVEPAVCYLYGRFDSKLGEYTTRYFNYGGSGGWMADKNSLVKELESIEVEIYVLLPKRRPSKAAKKIWGGFLPEIAIKAQKVALEFCKENGIPSFTGRSVTMDEQQHSLIIKGKSGCRFHMRVRNSRFTEKDLNDRKLVCLL